MRQPGLLLTAQETAEYLQFTERWVRAMARQGQIPSVKIGRRWRFPADRLRAWVDAGMPVPTDQPTLFDFGQEQ